MGLVRVLFQKSRMLFEKCFAKSRSGPVVNSLAASLKCAQQVRKTRSLALCTVICSLASRAAASVMSTGCCGLCVSGPMWEVQGSSSCCPSVIAALLVRLSGEEGV